MVLNQLQQSRGTRPESRSNDEHPSRDAEITGLVCEIAGEVVVSTSPDEVGEGHPEVGSTGNQKQHIS